MELKTQEKVELSEKMRLDKWLADTFSDWTRSQIKIQIESGGVCVNGKTVSKAGYIIKDGDLIDLNFCQDNRLQTAQAQNIDLDIVFEDDDLAVINKPQGMVVHPAPGAYDGTLVNALLYHFANISDGTSSIRPGIVHRIDKDTSGLLVVAKNNIAHENLAKQIGSHSAFRHYMALVEGVVKEDSGTICQPIGRSKADRKQMAVSQDGKPAITHFTVVERFKDYTLVKFQLETGRTHQIRVHSKFIGHPIVGDKTYGFAKQKFNLDGQLLHAYKLELNMPSTGERRVFEADLPEYFAKTIKKLKKV